jgi:hypothetical protein
MGEVPVRSLSSTTDSSPFSWSSSRVVLWRARLSMYVRMYKIVLLKHKSKGCHFCANQRRRVLEALSQ